MGVCGSPNCGLRNWGNNGIPFWGIGIAATRTTKRNGVPVRWAGIHHCNESKRGGRDPTFENKMNRTPGNWHYDEWGHVCAGSQIIGVAYDTELDGGLDPLPWMENARLMAAAPEMFAIIKGLTSNNEHDTFRAKLRANELMQKLQVKLESHDTANV